MTAPNTSDTRPATDLVRSALFSMLETMEVDWSLVLDLYAGSGALGIEALSRGAERADFVDHGRRSCQAIKSNLDRTGLRENGSVYCIDSARALSSLKGTYGVVFVDPPYSDASLPAILERLDASNLIGEGAVVAVLHSARRPIGAIYGRMRRVKERRHGDTGISIYEVTSNKFPQEASS